MRSNYLVRVVEGKPIVVIKGFISIIGGKKINKPGIEIASTLNHVCNAANNTNGAALVLGDIENGSKYKSPIYWMRLCEIE